MIDPGFGQRIALRTADARELNSLTRTTLDQRSMTDRISIPSGDHLRGFGIGDFGEVVTRLVAKATIPELAGGAKPLRIRGADALSLDPWNDWRDPPLVGMSWCKARVGAADLLVCPALPLGSPVVPARRLDGSGDRGCSG